MPPAAKALSMADFRVGLGSQILNTRYSPTAMVRAGYLAAAASGLDSFWVAALFPVA
jgi:phthiodiolone/phenolphthiodiolone dimycocerosates ketoreductase